MNKPNTQTNNGNRFDTLKLCFIVLGTLSVVALIYTVAPIIKVMFSALFVGFTVYVLYKIWRGIQCSVQQSQFQP